MDAYARPGERKVGAHRPRVVHLPPAAAQPGTRSERQAAKEQVATARRAIKKSARRHLRTELEDELRETSTSPPEN